MKLIVPPLDGEGRRASEQGGVNPRAADSGTKLFAPPPQTPPHKEEGLSSHARIFFAAMNIPRIIAHRGASATAPENTLAAFRAAAAAKARWVEFDVSLTSDNRPVVFHDDRLDRTSDGSGLLAETSFETLKHLDAGSWF